jgi:hypothetical protein
MAGSHTECPFHLMSPVLLPIANQSEDVPMNKSRDLIEWGLLALLATVATVAWSSMAAASEEGPYRIAYHVNFVVVIDSSGMVTECHLDTVDAAQDVPRDFHPSKEFLVKACDTFRGRAWSTGGGPARALRDVCFFSFSVPNEPLCPSDVDE